MRGGERGRKKEKMLAGRPHDSEKKSLSTNGMPLIEQAISYRLRTRLLIGVVWKR